MKQCKLFVHCLIFVLFNQSCAYITDIITWEKDGQKIIGCGDVHDFHMLSDNVAQRKFLFDNLANLDRQKTRILVEDDQEYHGTNELIEGFIAQSPAMFPQDGLIALIRRCNPGIETFNLEYRYARSAALDKFVQHDLEAPVTARAVIQEFDTMVSTVRSYNDGEQLTKLYQDHIERLKDSNSQILDIIREFPGTMTDWIKSHIPEEKQKLFARRLRMWDTCLLNFCAIHTVAHSQFSKQLIFAGAAHIFHVGKILEHVLGFKKTSSIGIDLEIPDTPTSLSLDTLRPLAPPEKTLSRFKPLPAEELAVLFEDSSR